MAEHMPDVERLLRSFIADFEADRSTRPQAYLEQVGGTDRRELEALIDAYLERAPRCARQPAASRRGLARRARERCSPGPRRPTRASWRPRRPAPPPRTSAPTKRGTTSTSCSAGPSEDRAAHRPPEHHAAPPQP